MPFEIPKHSDDIGGINEQNGEFFITDPETLRTLEAREQALEKNIASLESKIKDITITLSSPENEKMKSELIDFYTRILEDALERVATLKRKRSSQTIH